jgi:hypothetical protein
MGAGLPSKAAAVYCSAAVLVVPPDLPRTVSRLVQRLCSVLSDLVRGVGVQCDTQPWCQYGTDGQLSMVMLQFVVRGLQMCKQHHTCMASLVHVLRIVTIRIQCSRCRLGLPAGSRK